MRIKQKQFQFILVLFLLALAWPVFSQENDETEANIDTTVAVWGNYVDEDSSKAEEYGEVPEGFLINFLKVDVGLKSDRYLEVRAKNVGLNNGRYGLDYGVHGTYGLYVDYNKIPHLFSKSGETIWTELAPGQWRLADSIQDTIQDLNPFDPVTDPVNYGPALFQQRLFIKNLLLNANPTPLGLQRNRGTVGFNYSPNTTWKYGVEYFRENRDGTRPFGTAFGFSWVTELPEHIDYSTDRFRAGVEYSKEGKSFSAMYDLSLFRNEVDQFIWDNPYRIADRTYSNAYVNGDGTSQARVQLPVDNTGNMLTFAGATGLGKGRLTGNFSWNTWTDEVTLLPHTINSAINNDPESAALLQLPSATFNGDIRNITANLRYYVPVGKGNLTANYRFYDQSNNNDQFTIEHYVRFDQVIEERLRVLCDPATNTCEPEESVTSLFAYTTNTFDFDFQTPFSDRFHWYAGYNFTKRDLEDRETNSTNTNSFKTGLDIAANDSTNLRLSYVYSQRRLDEFHIESEVYLPIYTPLVRYDIADLNRNQIRFLADFSLGEKSTLGVSAGYWKNDYQDIVFGLQEWQNYTIGADYSYALTSGSTFNVWYEHGQNKTDQTGQQTTVSSTTFKPTIQGAWTVGIDDKYDTVGAGYLWNAKDGKWTWDTSISYAKANGEADILGAATIRPTGAVGFEEVDDTDLINFKTGVTCKAFEHARFAIWYYVDDYQINDFAEDSIATDIIGPVPIPTGVTFPGTITLNAIQPDYSYHTGWIGFILTW
jgi:MtrB/PioB family decaheme-associated outer membrane protein